MKECKIIDLPKIHDHRGNLTFFESTNSIPFNIKRSFWIYDVPGGEIRGGHAMKINEEFIVSLSGSIEIEVDNGFIKKMFILNRSYYGLYIPSMHWRQMKNFSTNAVALVTSSTIYDESDYIRNYKNFLQLIRKK
jgi:hypothetical protein